MTDKTGSSAAPLCGCSQRGLSLRRHSRLPSRYLPLLAHANERAILKERHRIAREIHDTLGQSIAAISLHLEAARQSLTTSADEANTRIQSAVELACLSLDQVHCLVWDLKPPELNGQGLAGAVRYFVDRMATGKGTVVDFSLQGTPRPLPDRVTHAFLRICQEAVANAVRHAKASEIRVKLAYEPSQVKVTIQDNGHGFDPRTLDVGKGAGMVGMRERAESIASKFEVHSEPGLGTRVVAAANIRQWDRNVQALVQQPLR